MAKSKSNATPKSKITVIGGKALVIVESPTKAKTIRKFLGPNFIVESCMGHIRDLPQSSKDIPEKLKKEKWAQLGVNVDKDFEPLYCIPKDKVKVVKNLRDKLEEASSVYLATDEDREGESISWHLSEVLKPRVPVSRMVFNEITKEAIQKSLKDTREIDFNLVRAQEARRILDRLVGYTISPLLWKKIAYGLSAGRVQSVAVGLIVAREEERLKFKSAKYWSVTAQLMLKKESFEAKLLEWKGLRLATGKDFDDNTGELIGQKNLLVLKAEQSLEIQKLLRAAKYTVSQVEQKPVFRKPAAPFITSTLQQEANRKLGLSSRESMQVAQKLYEQGFITYMRTDSTFLSEEALKAARKNIKNKYGNEYLPEQPRSYAAKKVKGAQEAHEAIRPSGADFIDPDDTGLEGVQLKLYDLIWKRTMASQMVDAEQSQVSAKITAGEALFSSSGMTIVFPGFLRAYVEGSDDPEAELLDRENPLPALKVKDALDLQEIKDQEHDTKPPARYTEASLVQKMEKEGIGRPSTYASIIGTIIDRGYVKRAASALVPTFTALAVSRLLSEHLGQFVDLGFTSQMEKSLDNIALGEMDSQDYLKKIFLGPLGLRSLVEKQGDKIDPEIAREIKFAGFKNYNFRIGKYGAYVCKKVDGEEVCTSIPDQETPGDVTTEAVDKWIEQKINGADAIGVDPVTQQKIYVLNGRFGPYVQLGDITEENDKPKRASIPANTPIETVDLPKALQLLSLPKTLGEHPVVKKPVQVGLGRFGPYVVCDKDYRSIPKTESLFEVTFERAMELMSQPKKGRGNKTALREFDMPNGAKIQLFNGPYGPYLKLNKKNMSVPEGVTPEQLNVEQVATLFKDELEEATPAKKAKVVKKKAKKKT